MRPFQVSVGFLFFSFSVAASSVFQIRQREIGFPSYRKTYALAFESSTPIDTTISVEFVDKTGTVFKEKWSKRIKTNDFQACKAWPCKIDVVQLPSSMERGTCSIRVSNSIENTQQIFDWGKCEKLPVRPDETFLPDLTFADDISESGFEIVNEGASLISRQAKSLFIIEDREGSIIWSSINSHVLTLSNEATSTFFFNTPIANWQSHLGCKMTATIDVDYEIQEKKKKNNDLSVEFGNCEPTPDPERGDSFDFEPIISFSDHQLQINITNVGRLPLIRPHEILLTEVILYKTNGDSVTKTLETHSPLYGFGDISKLYDETVAQDICKVEVKVNSNFLINESRLNNNYKIVNFCQEKE